MRLSQIGWFALQLAIIGGTIWSFEVVKAAHPDEVGPQPYVEVIIGVTAALIVTLIILAVAEIPSMARDIRDDWRTRKQKRLLRRAEGYRATNEERR